MPIDGLDDSEFGFKQLRCRKCDTLVSELDINLDKMCAPCVNAAKTIFNHCIEQPVVAYAQFFRISEGIGLSKCEHRSKIEKVKTYLFKMLFVPSFENATSYSEVDTYFLPVYIEAGESAGEFDKNFDARKEKNRWYIFTESENGMVPAKIVHKKKDKFGMGYKEEGVNPDGTTDININIEEVTDSKIKAKLKEIWKPTE